MDPASLDQALTHRSFAFENNLAYDNERLEFLGDAIIAAVTSEYLYTTHPEADEGRLSKLRAHLVSRQLLGRRAGEMGLGGIILLGRGERETGGGKRWSILGSALEALVAVVYLRLGYATASQFIRRSILQPLAGVVPPRGVGDDFKSALQEWAQRVCRIVPVYARVGEEGPADSKSFHVEVKVAGRLLARGSGARIKAAENDAARRALDKIKAGEFDDLAGSLPPA
ncbi:MAG: ribonuclease III [bacterium]|nr:ribonuclease III [bacterium]